MEDLIKRKIQNELLHEGGNGNVRSPTVRKSALRNGNGSRSTESSSRHQMPRNMGDLRVKFKKSIRTIQYETGEQPHAGQSLENRIQRKLANERDKISSLKKKIDTQKNDYDALKTLEYHIQRKLAIEKITNAVPKDTNRPKSKNSRRKKSTRRNPELELEERIRRKQARYKHKKDITSTERNNDDNSVENPNNETDSIENRIKKKITANKDNESSNNRSQHNQPSITRSLENRIQKEIVKERDKESLPTEKSKSRELPPLGNRRRRSAPEPESASRSLEVQIQRKMSKNTAVTNEEQLRQQNDRSSAEQQLESRIDQKLGTDNANNVSATHSRSSVGPRRRVSANGAQRIGKDNETLSNARRPSKGPKTTHSTSSESESYRTPRNIYTEGLLSQASSLSSYERLERQPLRNSNTSSLFRTSNHVPKYLNDLGSDHSVSSFLISDVSVSSVSDDNDDNLIIDAVVVNEEGEKEEKEKSRLKCMRYIYIGAILLFFTVASITITTTKVFFLDDTSKRETLVPTAFPTSLSSPPPSSTRFVELLNIISSVSDIHTLHDQSSPQYKALLWLAYEDKTSVDAPNLIQRYVLAVFYYSMNGDDWYLCANKEDGCRCSDNVENGRDVACQELEDRHLQQLSLGSECDWFNYKCDDDENDWITQMDFGSGSGNNLRGTIPSELRFLNKLRRINFPNNEISGTIPNVFQNMTDLLTFAIPRNKLFGSIPESIFEVSSLRSLDFRSNEMDGTLSPLFGRLENLRSISLGQNSFEGSLPSELSSITRLERLTVWGNRFIGSLPDKLFNMSQINTFDVRQNKINGTIPMEINLPSLRNFSISNNNIEGEIPKKLFDSKKLKILDVAENSLSGTLSPAMGELALSNLALYGNNFYGSLPQSVCERIEQYQLTARCSMIDDCTPGCCSCIL